MNSEKKDGIKPLLKKLLPAMAVLNLVVYPVTLIWGFDVTMIVGLVVGYFYSAFGCIYLAKTINAAVKRTKAKASAMMMSCYLIRFLGLGVLGYLALEYDFMNFVGLLLPQFYPKIILSLMTFLTKRGNINGWS